MDQALQPEQTAADIAEQQVSEQVTESCDGEVFALSRARNISKRMFLGGFLFLPFMWAMNVWLFWPDFRGARGDPHIKKYTRGSAIGFVVATCIFLPWLLIYAIAGDKVLSDKVYNALDAEALDLSQYGLGIIDPNK